MECPQSSPFFGVKKCKLALSLPLLFTLKRLWSLYLCKTLCIRTFICRILQKSQSRFDPLSYKAISEKTLKAACTRLLLLFFFASGNFFFQYWGMFLFHFQADLIGRLILSQATFRFSLFFLQFLWILNCGLTIKREKKVNNSMLHFLLKIQTLRGVGKEWGVRLGSLGLFKRYTSFFPVTLKCAVLTFGTSKFCV